MNVYGIDIPDNYIKNPIIFKNQKLGKCETSFIDGARHIASLWETFERLGIIKPKK